MKDNPDTTAATADNRDGVPFDVPSLVVRCLNDEAFATEMLRLFAQQAPELVAKFDAAFAKGVPGDVAKAAHALKGSAGNVSAIRAAEAARVVEDEGKAGRLPAVEAVQSLRAEVARCIAYVESMDAKT